MIILEGEVLRFNAKHSRFSDTVHNRGGILTELKYGGVL
jgi:hypothetical protein